MSAYSPTAGAVMRAAIEVIGLELRGKSKNLKIGSPGVSRCGARSADGLACPLIPQLRAP
jgi:hypothetical protein